MEWDRLINRATDLLTWFGHVLPTTYIHTYAHMHLTIYIYTYHDYLPHWFTSHAFVLWSWPQFCWWCAEKSATSRVTKWSKQSLCSLVKGCPCEWRPHDNSSPFDPTHCVIDKCEWSRLGICSPSLAGRMRWSHDAFLGIFPVYAPPVFLRWLCAVL